MRDVVAFKLASIFFTFASGLGGVMLPRILKQAHTSERTISLANIMSAGVMLGGGLLHLLPDAAEDVGEAWSGEYPLAYLLFSAGLLLPLIVESVAQAAVGSAAATSSKTRQADSDATWSELTDLSTADCRADASDAPLCASCFGPTRTEEASTRARARLAKSHLGSEAEPHDHGIPRDMPLSSALFLLAALSFHSVLEGLAQGTAATLDTTFVLLVAILFHKGLAAFALGCLFVEARMPHRLAFGLGLLFSGATPAGIVVGMLIPAGTGTHSSLLSSSLVAMAGGSFTFVAVLEILPRELHSRTHLGVGKGAQMTALASGFGAMALLALWL